MRPARAAAIVTWIYAALFGLPALPIAFTEYQTGELPWLGTLVQLYSGPWTAGNDPLVVAELLVAFFVLTLVAALSGWWLFKQWRHGGMLNLSVMVAEAMFWFGFSLPLAALFGLARVVLVAIAWRHLRDHHGLQPV